jgi:hypothetical protein
MADLITDAYGPPCVSIAVLKPQEIIDVVWTLNDDEAEVEPKTLEQSLFEEDGQKPITIPVRKLPVRFYYVFRTTDGKDRQLMIEDWEIGALYWNIIDKSGDQTEAIEKVIAKCKYLANKTDLYLILGTVFRNHAVKSNNPFVIIGLFYPPRALQFPLFLDQDNFI